MSTGPTGKYTVIRRHAATSAKGKSKASTVAPDEFEVTASVQPATGRDLQRLPEGRRTEETKTVITTTRLQVGGQGAEYEADRVVIDGAEWEAQNVKDWPGHCECLVQLASAGPTKEVNPPA